MRILIVDDEQPIRFLLAEYLSSHDCDEAATVDQAMTLLEEFKYDAVITDLQIEPWGDADGSDVIRHAQERAIPYIYLMSGNHNHGQAVAERYGIIFFPKPFDLKLLISELEKK